MARIVFEIDIEAPASKVVEARDTEEGIAGWWTPSVTFPGGVGSTLAPSFAAAPVPFELRVDEVGDGQVRWASVGTSRPTGRAPRSSGRLRPPTAAPECIS